MPSTAQQHYANVLANHYEWMFGVPFERKVAEQKDLLERLAGSGISGAFAIDLGCGSGFQSLALGEMGYDVLAIDTSEQLLGLLKERSANRAIQVVCADLSKVGLFADPSTADLIVCMGDTITHLPDRGAVLDLFRSAVRILKPGGRFILTYRDLAAGKLEGLDRFIPVHSDEHCIMTCFLEYSSLDKVVVNDLIQQRNESGK